MSPEWARVLFWLSVFWGVVGYFLWLVFFVY